MRAPEFPAPVDATTPWWVDDASDWVWDADERTWTRDLRRVVGGELSGVLLATVQTADPCGIYTMDVELVVSARSRGGAVVYLEELDDLIAALTAARDLMRGPMPTQRTCDDGPVRS